VPGKRAHPRERFLEHHAERERALVVLEVRDADDRRGRLAVDGLHPLSDVEVLSLSPAGERARRDQRVEIRREVRPRLLADVRLHGQRTDLGERRRDHVRQERGEIRRLLRCVTTLGDRREQRMRPALGRIGVAAHEAKDHRHGRLERGASAVDVVIPARRATLERAQEMERLAGIAARRDHADVRALAVVREVALGDRPSSSAPSSASRRSARPEACRRCRLRRRERPRPRARGASRRSSGTRA
jgi:hypothetical protein